MHKIVIQELKLNKNKTSELYAKFRDVCEIDVLEDSLQLYGVGEDGKPIYIEIDESVFMKENITRVASEMRRDFLFD